MSNFLTSESQYFFSVLIFIIGACIGSFANVVIYRMPRSESVITPGSHCFSCKKNIKWFHNIPIFSWIFLKGKCAYCGSPYSIRYLLVELIMGILYILCFYFSSSLFNLIEYLIFVFGLVVCSFIDLDHMILPDEFTLSGIVIGFIGSFFNPERDWLSSLMGIILGGGFLWATAYIYFVFTKQDGMGGGDIKLLAWIGAVLGWKAVPFVILTSAISGSLVGLIVSRKSIEGLKTAIPYGPYLAIGALFYMFGGESLASWYLEIFLPSFL